ncbi:hypothetical protein HDK77DRAFT_442802 [Phyllosticta capitalensis]
MYASENGVFQGTLLIALLCIPTQGQRQRLLLCVVVKFRPLVGRARQGKHGTTMLTKWPTRLQWHLLSRASPRCFDDRGRWWLRSRQQQNVTQHPPTTT